MDYASEPFAQPGWSTQLLVVPRLVAIDLRVWVAPERQRWSVCAASFDHAQERQLSNHVGRERKGLKLAEVKYSLMNDLLREWNDYVAPAGPFDT